MSSPIVSPVSGTFTKLGQGALDMMDGDTIRRALAGMLNVPQISPDYHPPTQWHNDMVDKANQAFQQQAQPPAPVIRRRMPPPVQR